MDLPLDSDSSGICDMSFGTNRNIVKKDAIHHHIEPPALTLKSVITIISDRLLNKGFIFIKGLDNNFKEFLISLLTNDNDTNTKIISIESVDFTNFCNTIFSLISSLITSMAPFKEGTGELLDEAVKSIATAFTNNAALVIVAYKDCIVPFITTPTRQNSATKDVCRLLIIGANFEQIWKALIHESLPNCHTQHSLARLTAMQHTDLNDTVTDQTKVAIRLGDLSTSELD